VRNEREIKLTARAIVRTLDACGDNVEKKERFMASCLGDVVSTVERQEKTISDLTRLVVRRNGRAPEKGYKHLR
jgi:hypothetical protein